MNDIDDAIKRHKLAKALRKKGIAVGSDEPESGDLVLTKSEKKMLASMIAGKGGRSRLALGTAVLNWHNLAAYSLGRKGVLETRGMLWYPGPRFDEARRQL